MQDFDLIIYGKEYSKECALAKAFFQRLAIAFQYIDIEGDEELMAMFQSRKIAGVPLIKLIIKNREYLYVGYREKAYVKLSELIRAAQRETSESSLTSDVLQSPPPQGSEPTPGGFVE